MTLVSSVAQWEASLPISMPNAAEENLEMCLLQTTQQELVH